MAEKKKKRKKKKKLNTKIKIKKPVFKKPEFNFSKIGNTLKYNLTKFIVPLCGVLLIGIAILLFLEMFKVRTVTVEGATHYSNEEIMDYVLDSKLCRNTFFVYLKYHNKNIKNLPFIEQIDVNIVDRNTVKINVYEKYVAGCVSTLGNFLYFDNDGKIVEISSVKTQNVPVITGLEFDHFELYEPLEVENADVFNSILTITKLLNKYELNADIIYFDENQNITLFFDKVRVNVGTVADLNEKFMTLPMILPSLEGKSGVLHMENFSSKKSNVVFNEDIE